MEKTELRLVFDQSKVENLENQVSGIDEKISKLETLLRNFSKFHAYPKWITKAQAFEILPFKSDYELNKWVDRGVIQVKDASDSGRIKVYLKDHCIDFPDRVEDWKKRGSIDPLPSE